MHPSSGRPPRREHWGDDRRRQLPLGERPRDEGGRGECGRRVLFPADRHAADIGERIERGVSLPEEGHGTRVSGGSSGDASPPPADRSDANVGRRITGSIPLIEDGITARFGGSERPPRGKYLGEDRRRRPPPRKRQRDEVPQEMHRRRTLPADDRHAANMGGGSPAGFPSLKMATRRGAGGRRTGGAPSTRTTATPRILWGGIAGVVSFPEDGHARRFGGKGTVGASSFRTTAMPQLSGGGSPASLSLTEATGRGWTGGVAEAHPPPPTTATP